MQTFLIVVFTLLLLMNKNRTVSAIVSGMQEKKGRSIVVADLTGIEDTVCDYFVICTANSPLQAHAIVRSIGETVLAQAASRPVAVDGLDNAQWVAMDYADVIVHVLLPEQRAFYDIEHLWADADIEEIEDIE